MKKSNLKTIGKALKESIKVRSKLSLIIILLGFGMAFVPSIMAVTLERFTNIMQNLMTGQALLADALKCFLVLFCLFILQQFFQFFQSLTNEHDTKITMLNYIQRKLFALKCGVDYKYIENYDKFNDRVTFAETQSGKQVAASLQNMVGLLQSMITLVSITYLLYNVSPLIVIVLLITSIPAMILSYLQKDELYIENTKWNEDNNLVLYAYYISCCEYNLEEVRHFGLFPYLKKRWKKLANVYIDRKKKLTIKHVTYNSIADFLRSAVYIAILLMVAGKIYENPAMGLGTFTLVYTLSGKMQEVTASLLFGIVQLFGDIPYMKDFFYLDTLDMDQGDMKTPPLASGDIQFENVTFEYPNANVKALDNINLTIKAGEKIAIVGENGSGKSTFVNLLCGVLNPEKGCISVGGVKLKSHMAAARNTISVIFQDFGQYQDTLRHNITISDKNKKASDKDIIELSKRTKSYDVIAEQPMGLDEQIGTFNTNAKDLSGGQWQKISITRAAFRDHAKIMILDEPTSALDPIAEAELYKNFSELTGDKTTLLISHRLGITSVVDRILVFKDGKIIEDGNHEELIRNNGYYAEMYKAQAQWYV